jgi:hypothetical protein
MNAAWYGRFRSPRIGLERSEGGSGVGERGPRGLLPAELASTIRVEQRDQFVARMVAPFLLVRLDDAEGDLELGLVEASTSEGRLLLPSIGFETSVDSTHGAAAKPLGGRPASQRSLATALTKVRHHGAPLRKRSDTSKPFTERISVGRALNNDIVLRHKSVSKFHAWFECDDNDAYYLSDARSTNTTTVNRVKLRENGRVELHDGDEVRFGEVNTVFCLPGLLWDAMRGE